MKTTEKEEAAKKSSTDNPAEAKDKADKKEAKEVKDADTLTFEGILFLVFKF